MITVLITGVGSTPSQCAIKALRQSSLRLRVVGTDFNPANTIAGSAFCDAFYQVPPATCAEFIPTLLEICRREKAQVLIPVIDEELPSVASAIHQFESDNVKVAASPVDVLKIVMDKYRFPCWLSNAGFSAPKTSLLDDEKSLASFVFPAMMKPRFGRSSISVVRVDCLREVWEVKKKHPEVEFVVQERCDGIEYTCDVVVNNCGEVLGVVPRRRLEVRAGIIYKGFTELNKQLIDLTGEICRKVGVRYAANVQFIVTRHGPQCIELNPRFSGGLALTVAAGFNIPEVVVRLAMDLPVEPLRKFRQLFMARYWSEVFYPMESQQ
ncbi:MAG: ATP-grasp domain-containing protein [Candidatus Methanomethylicaceae archaeon]